MRTQAEKDHANKLAQIAQDKYCLSTNDIEVDDTPELSESEDGTWVQAWVWLNKEEIDEDV